jgi:hypothetical protein
MDIFSRLEKHCIHLSSVVFVSIKADEGDEAAKEQLKPIKHYLDDEPNKLEGFADEAKRFLTPIIESSTKSEN